MYESEANFLLRDEFKTFKKENAKQSRIEYVLSHPSEEWEVRKEHVDGGLIKVVGYELGEGT